MCIPRLRERRKAGAGRYRRANEREHGGTGGRKSECLVVPAKLGNDPKDPVEGRGHRNTELLEGKMTGPSRPGDISTRQQRIAELARQAPEMAFTTLAHHMDMAWMQEAFRRTRKDGAPGVDGLTAKDFEEGLEGNLQDLLDRAKSGTYKAPPVRRVYIPKGDGKSQRPLGVPAFGDKVLQRAVVMLLEPIYEQDFLDCSYGFRPGRSAHQALETARENLMAMGGGWVVDVDIKQFFNTLVHGHLREMLARRVRDGVITRLIGKWLNAGVMESGVLSFPEAGSPQGGVISPVLSNLYLHEVLDIWFKDTVLPRLRGRAFLVRYADDVAMGFAEEADARAVMAVLPKRFGRYGLTLHPEKTRLLDFRRPGSNRKGGQPPDPGSFNFLGFTFFWGKSRKGYWVIWQKTAKDRFTRALKRVWEWCRDHRHWSLAEQQKALTLKLRGHYQYYGITGNSRAINHFRLEVMKAWWRWLCRRSQKSRISWEQFNRLLKRYPLPPPITVHSRLRRAAKP